MFLENLNQNFSFPLTQACPDVEYPEADKTGQDRTRPDTVAVGDTVRIKAGAAYGGLDDKYRGIKVPPDKIGVPMTVVQVSVERKEALLKEVFSWVSLDYLTRQ